MSSTLLLSCIKSLSVNRNIPQACNLKPITIISSSNSPPKAGESAGFGNCCGFQDLSEECTFFVVFLSFCLFVFLSPGLEIVVGLRIVGVYSATSHGTARQLDRPECDSQEYACSGSLLQTCKKTKNTCILWSQNHKMSLQKLGRCQESFVNRISLISGPTFGSGEN